MPTFDTSDLIGRTFLLPPKKNAERHRAKVTRQVVEIIDQDNGQRVENICFILDIGNGKVEELDSEALPRRIKSLQEQSSKVRSDKSGDPKLTCLGTSFPETTWRPCNLTLKTKK